MGAPPTWKVQRQKGKQGIWYTELREREVRCPEASEGKRVICRMTRRADVQKLDVCPAL